MNSKACAHFRQNLIDWYDTHKRDLPWRHTRDPYFIWVSEIILQQTTVDQGLSYYYKFTNTYPTIFHLADADEKDVLKLWQGLGYYSRARNMHHTAGIVVKKYNGHFPDSYKELLELKGIGPYTAAAILSFAFNKSLAVTDGNVMRVVARLFAIEKPVNTTKGLSEVNKNLSHIFDTKQPGTFNQAIMEFGAQHCKVHKPLCNSCFAKDYCKAYADNLQFILPLKEAKTKTLDRYLFYFIPLFVENNSLCTYLNRRTAKDIWQHLYDFISFETTRKTSPQNFLKSKIFTQFLADNSIKRSAIDFYISKLYHHKLTHRHLHVTFISFVTPPLELGQPYIKTPLSQVKDYPLPKLLENFSNEKDFNNFCLNLLPVR